MDKNYLQLIDTNIAYYDAEYSNRLSCGFMRELHGDLHTNNILYDKKNFYLFDFLDFDDSYTTGDYLQDIGFLLADMYFFGGMHYHKNDDELFICFKGEVDIDLDGESVHLKEGEILHVKAGQKHMPVAESNCYLIRIKTVPHMEAVLEDGKII